MDGAVSRGSGRRRALVILVAAVAMTLGSTQAELEYTAAPPATPSSSDFAVDCLAVGAAVNAPGQIEDRGLSLFRDADQTLGPLTVRRSFDTSLPRSFATSAGAGDADAGVHSFVSWKPPRFDVRGVVAGKYDAQITAWATSVPRTGVFATSFHEPEDNMSAADFVAYQRHVYPLVKAANPTIKWGPVYMAYWWDSSQPSHFVGNPKAWFPGKKYADFVGLDWYGPDPQPMTKSASFRTWYQTMLPSGLPLYITEYGEYAVPVDGTPDPALEKARARSITQDAAWIAEHPRIRMWLLWQAVGATGDWRITDKASQEAWRAVAESGCPARGRASAKLGASSSG